MIFPTWILFITEGMFITEGICRNSKVFSDSSQIVDSKKKKMLYSNSLCFELLNLFCKNGFIHTGHEKLCHLQAKIFSSSSPAECPSQAALAWLVCQRHELKSELSKGGITRVMAIKNMCNFWHGRAEKPALGPCFLVWICISVVVLAGAHWGYREDWDKWVPVLGPAWHVRGQWIWGQL